MDVEGRVAAAPPAVEHCLLEWMHTLDRGRVHELRSGDPLVLLRARLRNRIDGVGAEPDDQVAASVALTLPHQRADERPDLDLDPGLLEHLTPGRLLERLAGLVVAGGHLPERPVCASLADHQDAAVADDEPTRRRQRRPHG